MVSESKIVKLSSMLNVVVQSRAGDQPDLGVDWEAAATPNLHQQNQSLSLQVPELQDHSEVDLEVIVVEDSVVGLGVEIAVDLEEETVVASVGVEVDLVEVEEVLDMVVEVVVTVEVTMEVDSKVVPQLVLLQVLVEEVGLEEVVLAVLMDLTELDLTLMDSGIEEMDMKIEDQVVAVEVVAMEIEIDKPVAKDDTMISTSQEKIETVDIEAEMMIKEEKDLTMILDTTTQGKGDTEKTPDLTTRWFVRWVLSTYLTLSKYFFCPLFLSL